MEMEGVVEIAESAFDPSGRFAFTPVAENLKWSIPHVREMLATMATRNRKAALVHGKTALGRLLKLVLLPLIRRKGIGRNLVHPAKLHDASNNVNHAFVPGIITDRDRRPGIGVEFLAADRMAFRRQRRNVKQLVFPPAEFLEDRRQCNLALTDGHRIQRLGVDAEFGNYGAPNARPNEVLKILFGNCESLQLSLILTFESCEDLLNQVGWCPGRLGEGWKRRKAQADDALEPRA
jgi:hypothetical protein